MEIIDTPNEPCKWCGHCRHTLTVPLHQRGRASPVCTTVPADGHPVPRGCVSFVSAEGQRVDVRAVEQPEDVHEYVGHWLYESASGYPYLYGDAWPLLIPEEARARAREAARTESKRRGIVKEAIEARAAAGRGEGGT